MKYDEFLKTKKPEINLSGFEVSGENINEKLFDFQKDLVKWAVRRGKAALFTMTGTGKTFMQIEWARIMFEKENKPVLIVSPLAVNLQTKLEGAKIDVDINLAESSGDIVNGINITNYEKLHKFDLSKFIAVVLDESSILKNFSGKIKQFIIDSFKNTKYKLACTATPSPNDFMELGNHSEFLDVMKRNEMLSTFFINDQDTTQKWRLKGHGVDIFWEWVASWAAVLERPSDLGYSDDGYILPDLNIIEKKIPGSFKIPGMLFDKKAETLNERKEIRRITLENRTEIAAEITNKSDDIFLVWCELNSESELLKNKISNSVEVKGSDKDQHKENAMIDFSENKTKCLITKPSIAGFGMNWQNCNNMIFVGLSDSFERYFQAIRRCWRFGQTKPVNVYIVYADGEGNVIDNIKRKESDSMKMISEMVKHTKKYVTENIHGVSHGNGKFKTLEVIKIPEWLNA